MKEKKKWRILPDRGLYATAAVIMAISVFSALLFWRIQSETVRDCWETLERMSQSVKREIELNLEADTRVLKTKAELIEHCTTIEEIQKHLGTEYDALSLEYRLLLPDNIVITKDSVLEESGISYEEEAAQGEHISNRDIALVSGRQIVRNFVPVEKDGKVMGMLYGVIYLDTLAQRMTFEQYGGENGVYIVDRESGDFLLDTLHNNLGNISELEIRETKEGYDFSEMQKGQRDGKSGRCVFMDKTVGEYLYYYYEPLNVNEWSMALSVRESVAFENAIKTKKNLLAFIALECLILIVYLLWMLIYVRKLNEANLARIEKEKEADLYQRKVIEAIGADYQIVWTVDYEKDTFAMFRTLSEAAIYFHSVSKNYTRYSEWITEYVSTYIAPQDRERVLKAVSLENIARHFEKEKAFSIECLRIFNGKEEYIQILFRSIDWENSREAVFAVKNMDETVRRELEQKKKAQEVAVRDALTGVMNRRAFDEMRARLHDEDVSIAFLLIDVDKFKDINDQYGHEQGDDVLKYVAAFLVKSFRSDDYVFRIGGDEFAVIMMDVSEKQIHVIREKVGRMNETLRGGHTGIPHVSLSVGVAISGNGFNDELYRQADKALYKVKENGRNNCEIYLAE